MQEPNAAVWQTMGAGLVGVFVGALALGAGLRQAEQRAPEDERDVIEPPERSGARTGDDAMTTRSDDLADTVAAVRDTVVSVRVGDRLEGAGVFFDREGLIFTNYHVVAPALVSAKLRSDRGRAGTLTADTSPPPAIVARMAHGRELATEVIAADRVEDIAVLRVLGLAGEAFPSARLGESSRLRVGEAVFAVGCPFGLEQTVSTGIVSGLDRTNVLANAQIPVMQLDASINLGSSGGPVFNRRGELVGITTARLASAEGIGFAIPIDRVRAFLAALAQGADESSGVVGVTLLPMVEVSRALAGSDYITGVLLGEVPDGPAKQAGIRAGDVLVELRGKRFDELGVGAEGRAQAAINFGRAVRAMRPGERVPIAVLRRRERLDVEIEVQAADPPRQARIDAQELLGLLLAEEMPGGDARPTRDAARGGSGEALIVLGIDRGARIAGREGAAGLISCELTHIFGRPVPDLAALGKRLAALRRVGRDGLERDINLTFQCGEQSVVVADYPLNRLTGSAR